MKKRYIILIIIFISVILIGGYIYVNQKPQDNESLEPSECVYKECPSGYIQYYSFECGLGPDGPVPCPPEIKEKFDCECHKECNYNEDICPEETPNCEEIQMSDTASWICLK